VGTVVQTQPDPKTPFMLIRVRSAAHLDRLEEVLILLTRQDLESAQTAEQAPAPATPQKTAAPPATPPATTATNDKPPVTPTPAPQ